MAHLDQFYNADRIRQRLRDPMQFSSTNYSPQIFPPHGGLETSAFNYHFASYITHYSTEYNYIPYIPYQYKYNIGTTCPLLIEVRLQTIDPPTDLHALHSCGSLFLVFGLHAVFNYWVLILHVLQ